MGDESGVELGWFWRFVFSRESFRAAAKECCAGDPNPKWMLHRAPFGAPNKPVTKLFMINTLYIEGVINSAGIGR